MDGECARHLAGPPMSAIAALVCLLTHKGRSYPLTRRGRPSLLTSPLGRKGIERISRRVNEAYRVRPGFWRTVVPYVTGHRTPSSSCVSRHQMETPADLLARQYPTLFIQAYAGQYAPGPCAPHTRPLRAHETQEHARSASTATLRSGCCCLYLLLSAHFPWSMNPHISAGR